MPTLAVNNFNIVCATLGSFIAIFGLVSFLFKEKFYLSETLISLIAGVIFSPHVTNLIRPLQYSLGNEATLATVTLFFSRLVLGIQLVIAGVQLPSKYLQREWRGLAYLLGPGMVAMWLCTSLLVWALVPKLPFLYALAVGACVTPTDPVLANNIVKGKFADKNIPRDLQHIIIAESGANDGLGYPFLFLPLYLIKFVALEGQAGGAGKAIGMWFYEIWVYQILLGVLYGAVVGWIAKELLHFAEERKYVDRESFLVFAVALALFIVGTAGLIGSDDVLACFIAGNTFTWDDWFRKETKDDSLQPTVDMLLNVSFFLWIGAVCPWNLFGDNTVIPVYRLIFLGVMVLLFRRLPFVLFIHRHIYQIEEIRQALFVGYFGPIGVSAIFYLYIALDWLEENVKLGDEENPEAQRLGDVLTVVVWFLVICSILVHGLSIPLGKLGLYLPRTLSRAISQDERERSGSPSPPHLPRLPGLHSFSSPSSPRSISTPHLVPPAAFGYSSTTRMPPPAAPAVAATAPAAVGSTSVARPGPLRQLGRVGRAVARSLSGGGMGGSDGSRDGSGSTPRLLPSSSTLGFAPAQHPPPPTAATGAGHPGSASESRGSIGAVGAEAAAAAGNSPPRSGEPYFARSVRFPD